MSHSSIEAVSALLLKVKEQTISVALNYSYQSAKLYSKAKITKSKLMFARFFCQLFSAEL
jgi:hypothetical protein